MIGRLRGRLVEVDENQLVIDVGGVGYEVLVTTGALGLLPELDQELALFTHFVVRDDAQLLYGFQSRDERELFRALVRVNGVGPKMAITLLSSIAAGEFARCIIEKDYAALVKVQGVGRKTAERLVIELQDKLEIIPIHIAAQPQQATKNALAEAERALVALGYRVQDAARVLDQVYADNLTSEEMVRAALKRIAQASEALS